MFSGGVAGETASVGIGGETGGTAAKLTGVEIAVAVGLTVAVGAAVSARAGAGVATAKEIAGGFFG